MASEPNFDRLVAVMRRLRRGGGENATQEKPVTNSLACTNCQHLTQDSQAQPLTTRSATSYQAQPANTWSAPENVSETVSA